MSACQLGKGRNCREGVAHKQGDWRLFEQPETYFACTSPSRGKSYRRTAAPTGLLQPQPLQ